LVLARSKIHVGNCLGFVGGQQPEGLDEVRDPFDAAAVENRLEAARTADSNFAPVRFRDEVFKHGEAWQQRHQRLDEFRELLVGRHRLCAGELGRGHAQANQHSKRMLDHAGPVRPPKFGDAERDDDIGRTVGREMRFQRKSQGFELGVARALLPRLRADGRDACLWLVCRRCRLHTAGATGPIPVPPTNQRSPASR
jgi:hypothetical protein